MKSTSNHDQPNAVGLQQILATDQLHRRAARPANFRVESQVMAILAQTLADRPHDILHVLVRTAVELCGGGTCGISLLEPEGDEDVFRWVALAGVCEKHEGGCTPRNHSPCGVTLDRGEPQLFVQPGRYFTYLGSLEPGIAEGLVIPFFHEDEAFGTIWIASHDSARHFDPEDVRLMTRLAAFTAAGLRTNRSLKIADKARQDLTFLGQLRQQLASAAALDEIGRIAVAAIGEHFAADYCCLLQRDREHHRATIPNIWYADKATGFAPNEALACFGGLEFWNTALQGPWSDVNVSADSASPEHFQSLRALGVSSFASTPCMRQLGSDAVLWMGMKRSREWTAGELNLLEVVASQVSACCLAARAL